MASFTDTPQAYLSQYTPSVDLSLYANTLDFKQQQYNQGVQRIQGSIDQVAGLDIMHPLAKEYLQNKLTELGSKVNSMAGGDFSNQSLVGQAMMLAPQVAKDTKVQNAVISTQQIRSLNSSQAAMDKAGKYTDVERYWDNRDVMKYLNTTDLNDGYHGASQATQHVDGEGLLAAAIKEKEPDTSVNLTNQNIIEYLKDKRTSRLPSQIKAIIDSEIQNNPDIAKHFQMLGVYNYRNYDAPALQAMVDQQHQTTVRKYSQMLDALDQKKVAGKPLDVDTYNALREQIIQQASEWLTHKEGGEEVPGYYDQISKSIRNGDLDGAKSTLQWRSSEANMIQKYTKDDHDLTLQKNEATQFMYDEKHKNFADRIKGLEYNQKQLEDLHKWSMDDWQMFTWKKEHPNLTEEGSLKGVKSNAPGSDSYDINAHQKRIDTLDPIANPDNGSLREDLKKEWLTQNQVQEKRKDGESLDAYNARVEGDFKLYKTTQEGLYTNNDAGIDGAYKDWRNRNQAVLSTYNDLQKTKQNIEATADEKHKVSGVVTIPVNYTRDGQKYNQIAADLNSTFRHAFEDIETRLKNYSDKNGYDYYEQDPESNEFYNYKKDFIKQQVERYKGDPKLYSQLKAISDNGYDKWKQAKGIMFDPISKVMQAKNKDIETAYKDIGKNVNYTTKIIKDKDERADLTTALVNMDNGDDATSQLSDLHLDQSDISSKGLKVTSVYRDDAGNMHIVGKDFKGNDFDKVPNLKQESTTAYIPMDNYRFISDQLATHGQTSMEASDALHSSNNKVSYAIKKDAAGLRVWVIGKGGNPIRTDATAPDINTIIQKMELASQEKSRDEIINILNHPKKK